ncbi:MAG: TRAP transporter substrate-binding protein DctP [Rhodospirillaceae bacterium]
MYRTLLGAALSATAALALCAPAATAQTVKFAIIAPSPINVTPTKVTKEYFVPEVTKRLAASGKGFKIEWNEAYGPQLAKFTEVLENIEEGIAHMGVILRNFEESKLPLEQYPAMIPFGITDSFDMLKVDARVRQRVPEMNKQFDKYNQILLSSSISENMHMFTNFPIKTVDDMKGHKIGSSGTLGHVLRGTGAVLVTAAMTQSYLDIKNGVYEGYTIGEGLAFPYRTFESAQYLTRTYFGVTTVPSLAINKDAWNKLPEHARQIIQEVATEWAQRSVAMDRERLKHDTDAMVAKGLKVHDLPTEERQKWAKAMPNVAKEWADNMDKQGLPGAKLLTAYMDEVRASGKPVVRQWDKE